MFTILVILLGIFLAYMFGNDGNTTAMWVVIGLAAFVVFGIYISHEDDKAYVNRMHYWAMSGKDRARARRSWNAEARAEEERERLERIHREERRERRRRPKKRELEEARRKREAYVAELRSRNGSQQNVQKVPSHVCHYCGRMVNAYGTRVLTGTGVMVEYNCPRCGMVNHTKLGGT